MGEGMKRAFRAARATRGEAPKAWEQPWGWSPKKPCFECEGDGMGPRKTYNGNELVDWDDCRECKGTGETTPATQKGNEDARI